MTKLVWYIHGANATPRSFAWIKNNLPHHMVRDVSYSVDEPLEANISHLIALAREEHGEIDIVAHSMGGIIAAEIARASDKVRHILTMSTPFGGSKAADMMRWITPCQLFEDIRTNSPIITELRRKGISVPMRCLVTTAGGRHIFKEPNDGVVSVASQLELNGPDYIRLPLNHFEILLANESVEHIKDFIFDVREAAASDLPYRLTG